LRARNMYLSIHLREGFRTCQPTTYYNLERQDVRMATVTGK
jgi:hypothetical protein